MESMSIASKMYELNRSRVATESFSSETYKMGVGRNVYVYFVTAEICKKFMPTTLITKTSVQAEWGQLMTTLCKGSLVI